jgi:hypothetical protein
MKPLPAIIAIVVVIVYNIAMKSLYKTDGFSIRDTIISGLIAIIVYEAVNYGIRRKGKK